MGEVRLTLRPTSWSTQQPSPPGTCGRDTLNQNTARGFRYPDRGYRIDQQVAASIVSKAASSQVHRGKNSSEFIWHTLDTKLYVDDAGGPTIFGIDIPADIFGPSSCNMASPSGQTALLVGDDTKSQLIRDDGASSLEAVLLKFPGPPVAASVGTGTTGGTIPDGSYFCRECWIDKDGDTIDVLTAPSAATEIITTGGDLSVITRDEPGSPPARATHVRVAFTLVDTLDAPSNYLHFEDVAVGFSPDPRVYASLPTVSTIQAFRDINGNFMQAEPNIVDADICILHEGRMIFAAKTGSNVGWSDRNNLNQFFPDQSTDAGAESSWNSPVVGLASAEGGIYIFTSTSVHQMFGDFSRDDQGLAASFIVTVGTRVVDHNIGCVSHASIRVVAGITYFFSTRGPAVVIGGRVKLINPEDLQNYMDCDFDWDFGDRVVCAEDPELNMVCWAIPRRPNTDRPQDGASVAGICDRLLRWDTIHGFWSPPLGFDGLVHIQTRVNGAVDDTSLRTFFMAMGQHGTSLQMNFGHSAGGPLIKTAVHDGQLAVANSATQITMSQASVGVDDLVGQQITLFYPTTDNNFPGEIVQKMIVSNTATVSGQIDINWEGALTAPTGTMWTVRLASMISALDVPYDPHDLLEADPESEFDVMEIDLRHRDVVGVEGRA